MAQEPLAVEMEAESRSARHMVHMLMQFALAVRYRKNLVIMALVVTLLLGGLYYLTAPRFYAAGASLLVTQADNRTWTPGTSPEDSWQRNLLPTYRSLISTPKVIQGAFAYFRPDQCEDFADEPRKKWVEIVQRNLSVKSIYRTNIIEVSYRSRDPEDAVTIVNAVVDSYLRFIEETYRGTAVEIAVILNKKMGEVETELAREEARQQELRRQSGDLGISPESKVLHPLVQSAITANDEYGEAQKQRIGLEVSLARMQAAVRKGEDLQQHVLAVADAVGRDVLLARLGLNPYTAGVQANLEEKLLEDQAELKSLEKSFAWDHPEVVAKSEEIRMTWQHLLEYPERIKRRATEIQDNELGPMLVEMVQQKLDEARQLEWSLRQRFQDAYNAAMRLSDELDQLASVEHKIKWLWDMRDTLRKQLEDTGLRREGNEIRAWAVREPEVDYKPVSPNPAKTALLALAMGLALGLGAVYVLDTVDDRFRSAEEMQTLLRAPVLAMVRELKAGEGVGIDALQAFAAPNAAESEAFRTLRTALSFADQDSNQIVISSPEPGDGKTTVLANLAVAMAQSGKRTLLIDADLRRPGLTALMGMRGTAGLTSVLRGEGDVAGMAAAHIRSSGFQDLDVLPSGPRPSNPAELLGSRRFSELLGWAEAVYDQVLVDSPPALATSDTIVVGRLTNAAVLVVQPAKNRRRTVTNCVESFSLMKIPLLGIVVNRVDSGRDGYYGYGGYYEYEYAGESGGDDDALGDRGVALVDSVGAVTDGADPHESGRSDQIVPRRVA